MSVCQQCEHGWLPITRSREDIASLHEELYVPAPPRRSIVARRLGRELRRSCGRNATKVLDIGCSSGTFLFNLDKRWEKYGVELNATRSMLASQYAHANVQNCFVEDCAFADDYFDCVTMFAVIEHVTHPRDLVHEAYRIVKPGGVMMLMTGDRTSWRARIAGDQWRLYRSPDHLHFFSGASLIGLLRENGFRIESCAWRWCFAPWRPRWLRSLFRLPRAVAYAAIEICPWCLRHNWGDQLYIICRKPAAREDSVRESVSRSRRACCR
ncbi:MAG: class I SAM-dependent methyltransferase [Pirellulales bacterium]|nr:class I SAM-dependent methyltransferase [Pirellulales bacterium]